MKKTMVYLDEEQFLLLKKEANSTKKKMAEIIREALTRYFSLKKVRANYFSFVGIAEGPKKGRTSEHVEEVLKEVLKK